MIGILDSGIGGLAAVREIVNRFPLVDLTYIGDTAEAPYGNKSREAIRSRVLKCLPVLLRENPRLLAATCHNIAATSMDLVERFTDTPVIDAVTCSIQQASAAVPGKGGIGVIGDRTAVSGGIYETGLKRLSPEAKVYTRICPLLIPVIEEGYAQKPESRMLIKKYVFPLKVRQVNALLLGSTAYSVIRKEIRRKAPKRTYIVDTSVAIRDTIIKVLEQNPEMHAAVCKNGHKRFFVTDVTNHIKDAARRIYGANIELNRIVV